MMQGAFSRPEEDICNRHAYIFLTRLGDVIPIWRVKLILRLKDLLKEFGVVFIIERGIPTEPNGEQEKRDVTLRPASAKKLRKRKGQEGETLVSDFSQ